MGNKNTIRVSEFEKLYYDNAKPFKQKHWEALCRYQEEQYKKGEKGIEYYRILNKGVQFTNYVGVIQAGNLTIEVLPKTDKQQTKAANATVAELSNEDAERRQCWHSVLLQMLKECRLLRVNHVDYANLNLKSNSILEIYIELFLAEAERLLHQGLIKKYSKKEGNNFALKGQLLFSKNINQNLVHQERFYIRYAEYNRINIFNQLLYKTLGVISSITSSSYLIDKVNRLLLDFPEMPDCNVSPSTFDKLVYDRKTEHYKEALLIAKMLLLNYRPDITGGTENIIAILFDMNKLWEEFVFRRIQKAASGGMKISRQQKKDFWWHEKKQYHKTVKPDIVITKDEKTYILDTKWKINEDVNPGDDDLKQLFVYNLLWDAEHSYLVYPGSYSGTKGSYVHFELSLTKKRTKDEEYFSHCSLVYTNVLDDCDRLDKNLGPKILDKLFNK